MNRTIWCNEKVEQWTSNKVRYHLLYILISPILYQQLRFIRLFPANAKRNTLITLSSFTNCWKLLNWSGLIQGWRLWLSGHWVVFCTFWKTQILFLRKIQNKFIYNFKFHQGRLPFLQEMKSCLLKLLLFMVLSLLQDTRRVLFLFSYFEVVRNERFSIISN